MKYAGELLTTSTTKDHIGAIVSIHFAQPCHRERDHGAVATEALVEISSNLEDIRT